MAILVQPPRK